MSIDLTKLTPAPWEQDETWLVYGRGMWPEGKPKTLRETSGFAKFNLKEDAEFAALARNAFAVMLRRGWGVSFTWVNKGGDQKKWLVMSSNGYRLLPIGRNGEYFTADDPFTALVEADAWYKANVESGDGKEVPEG